MRKWIITLVVFPILWCTKNYRFIKREYKRLEKKLKNPTTWTSFKKAWNIKRRIALAPELEFRKREMRIPLRERFNMIRHSVSSEDVLFSIQFDEFDDYEWERVQNDTLRAKQNLASYHAKTVQEKEKKAGEGFTYDEYGKERTAIVLGDGGDMEKAVLKARAIDEYKENPDS